jgi:GAF domain-containing protein
MKDLLKAAVDETHAWAGTIMVPNIEEDTLECIAGYNLPEGWENITNALNETTANGRCYLSGEPIVIQDQEIAQPRGATAHHKMYALTVLPIKSSIEVIGTLEVIKDEVGSVFDTQELDVLQAIAIQLGTLSV